MEKKEHKFTFEDSEGKTISYVLDDFQYWSILSGHQPLDKNNMPMYPRDHFKKLSKLIKKEVKKYLKGQFKHLSKVDDDYWRYLTGGADIKQKGSTYEKQDNE